MKVKDRDSQGDEFQCEALNDSTQSSNSAMQLFRVTGSRKVAIPPALLLLQAKNIYGGQLNLTGADMQLCEAALRLSRSKLLFAGNLNSCCFH